MNLEKITSRSNEKIKTFQHLSQSSSYRKQAGLFALEGARICYDASINNIEIKSSFFTSDALKKYPDYIEAILDKSEKSYEITSELASKMSDTVNPQGVFCICVQSVSSAEDSIDTKGTYIALDNMQNPANLGAVLRTAEAFGITGVIVGGGCDIYNPKALRAAMGSTLRIPVITTGNLPALLIFAHKKGMLTLASTPASDAKRITDMEFNGSVICVIGNEGSGISQEVKQASDVLVTIPMKGRAESLNAAAAASVLIWELTK